MNNIIQNILLIISIFALILSSCDNNNKSEVKIDKKLIDSIVEYKVDSILNQQYENEKLFGTYNYFPDTVIINYLRNNTNFVDDIIGYYENGKLYFEDTFDVDKFYSSGYRIIIDSNYVTRELFYKDNERDSLMFDYYENNILESKGFYRNGKKDGIFIDLYSNGNLKLEAYYENDILIGNKIEYYSNRKIKAIGNDYNGIYKEFDEYGFLFKETIFENGKIVTINRYYSDNLRNNPRQKFIGTKLISDTTVINNTSLKIDYLFDQYIDPYKYGFDTLQYNFGTQIYSRPYLASNNDEISVHFHQGRTIIIKENGIEICDSCLDLKNELEIKSYFFYKNSIQYVKSDSTYGYKPVTETFSTDIGTVKVTSEAPDCDDTGNNPITIISKGKTLKLNFTHNVFIFEYDYNKDGKNELYIFSYRACRSSMRIYKIYEW